MLARVQLRECVDMTFSELYSSSEAILNDDHVGSSLELVCKSVEVMRHRLLKSCNSCLLGNSSLTVIREIKKEKKNVIVERWLHLAGAHTIRCSNSEYRVIRLTGRPSRSIYVHMHDLLKTSRPGC